MHIFQFHFTILNYNVINKVLFYSHNGLSYWLCVWLNNPVDISSATQGRAGYFTLSAVHIPAISGCGSMLGFTALHPWNDWANKDSLECQSETISKEIPSVTTPTSPTSNTLTHTHRAQDRVREDGVSAVGAPEFMKERHPKMKHPGYKMPQSRNKERAFAGGDNFG